MNKFILAMALILLTILVLITMNNTENFQSTAQVSLHNSTMMYGNMPPGTIVSWCHDAQLDSNNKLIHGANSRIPIEWVVCDGRKYTKTDGTTGHTPNLVGKFIYGARGETGTNIGYANVTDDSSNWTPGVDTNEYKGGVAGDRGTAGMYNDSSGNYGQHDNHTTPGAMGGKRKVALTIQEIPNHHHRTYATDTGGQYGTGTRANSSGQGCCASHGVNVWRPVPQWSWESTSGLPGNSGFPLGDIRTVNGANVAVHDQAHENMPPFYSLVYIMKKY